MLVDLVKHAVAQPTFVLHGVRKIVQGIHWTETTLPPSLDILRDLGYKPVKVTRLMNVYYNKDEVAKAKAKLKQRIGEEHSSVSILTRNMEKTHPITQGWCIQNVVISQRWKSKQCITTADVFYRSTEAIMKFGADITLLHNIFDALEVKPTPVRFYFANLYVSAVFFPLLFRHTDGVKFFEHIRRHDKQFWWLATKAVSRYLDPVNRYTYRAQVKQRELAQVLDREPIDEYFKKFPELWEYHQEHLPKRKSTVRKIN
jgi:hypothetical protein